MIGQMQAVTGRKPRQRYIDIINASTALLPSLYAAREQRDYQERMAAIEEDNLALARERLEEEKRQSEKALSLQKSQGRTANTLGMINLGLTGGLGYTKNKTLKDVLTSDSGGAISSGGPGVVSSGPMGFEKAQTTGIPEGVTTAAPGGWASGIPGALKSPGTYGYAGLGYGAGKLFGGKDKTKSALIGAGVGAGLNLLSGGSITSAVISGLLGGGGGFFG